MRGSTDFLVKESLPKRLQTLKDFEFLVVSPLGNGGMEFWSKDEMIDQVMKLLDETQSTYSVDAKRIYLTGAGMGGNGVWVMGMRNPNYFAALAPLGGYIYPFGLPENICNLKDVPVWAFHGEEDFMVPPKVEQDLANAVNTCGGVAKITIKPGAIVPIDVYYNSELFDWLLAQSKK
jgi:predicted peptidase